MIFLLYMILQPATGQTLGLILETGEISISKSRTENRASISFELNVTQTEVLSGFSSLKTIVTEWKALQCFVGESPLRENLYQALDPGSNQLEPLQSKYLHLFTYLGTGPTKSAASCSLKKEMLNGKLLSIGAKQLISVRTGVQMTGTAAEIFANKNILRAAADFALAYNNLISNLHLDIDETLSWINLLSEKEFPQTLRGELDSLPCLALSGSSYEQISVQKVNRGDGSILFDLETYEPESIANYTKMRPILYEDVRLYVPPNSLLVKALNTNKLILLDCENVLEALPTCTVSSDYADCLTALEQNDIDTSLTACLYEYATDVIGLRVKNEAILIQGKYLSVFQGDVAVIQNPPLLIKSNEIITVSSLTEEVKFSSAVNFSSTQIETTKLSGLQIASMKLRAYWKFVWSKLLTSEVLNYLSLILEAIFAPLSIVGLAMSCRRRVRNNRKDKRTLSKKSRKSNFESNMKLLERRSRK